MEWEKRKLLPPRQGSQAIMLPVMLPIRGYGWDGSCLTFDQLLT